MDTTERPTPEEAEARFRDLVDENDLPQPDHVDYHAGRRELMFTWDRKEIVVVVELDDEEPTRVGWRSEIGLLAAMESAELTLAPVEPSDLARVAELVHVYRDLSLGIVDASIIAAAERLGATTIATLDRRRFSVVHPAHVEAFALVP